jgi:type IV secretory pathway TraG/TraD family ATPase VirD4
MSPTKPFPETGSDPLAPLAQLGSWFLDTAGHIVLGLLLGMAAARFMRSRHLHWSWAGAVLVITVLAGPLLEGARTALGVAALSATLWSRRWHVYDVEAGTDLAEIAARRRGPLDLVRRAVRGLAMRRREAMGSDGWLCRGELIVAREENGRPVAIPFGGQTGGTHTLVVGATGSGKTVTQTWMVVRAIEHGMAAVVVDPKGDRSMRAELVRAARLAGRAFVEWTPNGPCVYNPYAGGSETEIADKALAGERFTEPHYLRQAQRYLGHAARALRKAGLAVSLQSIVHHLEPEELETLARSLADPDAESAHAYLDSLTPRQRSDLAGVRDRLAILAESDVGRWLDPSTEGAECFDLLEAVQARAVVYFDLASDTRPLLTQMLGAAIVQDLQTTVAALQGRPIPTLVVIDEFSAIAAEQVVRLFGRARSAGFSLVLGTQELADLRPAGRERLLEQVMGNLSVLVAHRQVVPDSAELIGSLAGVRGAWRTSRHSDGRMTRTRTQEPVLGSSDVTGLARGWAAVIVLTNGHSARIGHVLSVNGHR